MITSFKHGMKHFVSVEAFAQELRLKHAKASIVLAKRVAARMAKSSIERIKLNYDRNVVLADITLSDMARLHQVKHELIPFTVQLAQKLVHGQA